MNQRLLAIVTDAWTPHVNGVVRTLRETEQKLIDNHSLVPFFIQPDFFTNIRMKEMDFVIQTNTRKVMKSMFEYINPKYVHISTEGPLGLAARSICLENGWKFTTAYHTKFPEYLNMRFGVPTSLGYKYLRWFHRPSSCVMAATYELMAQLREHEFYNNFGLWSRGVDTKLFSPEYKYEDFYNPYAVYVGRVSKEKGIEEFLDAPTDLLKIVVGDGPLRPVLEKKYPKTLFVGKKSGVELARYYANAEVFVFPSVTDTFGLVMPEALACGVPVAAKPVSKSVVTPEVAGLHDDISMAIAMARRVDRSKCREFVLQNYTWEIATSQFFHNLVPVEG